MSANWKDLLGQIAPVAATLLGGPLAGMATKALSAKLLGHPDGTADDVGAALLGATPEQLLQVKQLDVELKTKLAELGVRADELEVEDRGSARALAVARGFLPQAVLSVVFVGGYFGILISMFAGALKIPPDHTELLSALLTVLGTGVVQILNFWFGSSHGSQKKDDALATAAVT